MADTPVDGFVASGYTNAGQKPGFTPAGASAGAWVFENGQWVWRTGAKAADPAANPTANGPKNSALNPVGVVPGSGTPTTPEAMQATNERIANEQALAKAKAAGNPFGNEMFGVQQQYTPFGLNQPSAFGGGFGGGGWGRGGYSYGSEQLVPNLEQRRMGMMNQMYLGGGR